MKQSHKIIIPLIIVAVGYTGWQARALVNNNKQDDYTQISAKQASPTPVILHHDTSQTLSTDSQHSSQLKQLQDEYQLLTTQRNVLKQKMALSIEQDYQQLQSRRKLLEEQVAISAAKTQLSILAKRNLEVDKTLTQAPATPISHYQLMFVDHEDGRWIATIRLKDIFYTVITGTILPDQSQIKSISSSGVTIQTNHQTIKLSLSGATLLSPLTIEHKTANPQAQNNPKKSAVKKVPHRRVSQRRRFSKSEQFLLNIPSKNFTLQLMASKNKTIVERYVLAHGLQRETLYYKTKIRNKAWYILVLGKYPSLSEAKLATKNMPEQLKRLKPVIRSFRQVHRAIRL